MTLREYAATQRDALPEEATEAREAAIDSWMHRLITIGDIPDDILAEMPEVSRHNDPQIGPQEYECGCVAITRVTDRNSSSWLGRLEAPFEMRLAVPCDGAACELAHLRKGLA